MPNTVATLLTRREELAQQLASLDEQIKQARDAERQSTLDQVKSLLAAAGLTAADLSSARTPGKRGALKGKKVAAKYRDSKTGEEWAGRGKQPKWLTAALADGKKLEEFAI